METLITVAQFFLSLSLLVILHELGHFLMARLFKTKVEKFYLFFNPGFSLFKKKIGETEYGIGWLPLGGYVKIAGMIDESMDKEFLDREPQPWEFRSKPAWQRLLIMLGGIIVNIILAIIIYIGMAYTWGDVKIPLDSLKDGIWVQNTVLKKIGLQTGDKIKAIDHEKVKYLEDVIGMPSPMILTAKSITVERNGKKETIDVPEDFINRLIESKKKEGLISPRIPFIVAQVLPDSPNKNAGLQKGDEIVEVNGTPVQYMDEVIELLKQNKGKKIQVKVKRNGTIIPLQLQVSQQGKIGVATHIDRKLIEERNLFRLEKQQYGFFGSIKKGLEKARITLTGYLKQLKMIFNPSTGAYKGVGSFFSIANLFPGQWDWQHFWEITAFLSIMLAILNLLPIPALDGGHAMFILYEMITGKQPGEKFLERAQMLGFIILIALMIFALKNDIVRFFFNK